MSFDFQVPAIAISNTSTQEVDINGGWTTLAGSTAFAADFPTAQDVLFTVTYSPPGLLTYQRFTVDGTAITDPNYLANGIPSDALWQESDVGIRTFNYAASISSGSHYFESQMELPSQGGNTAQHAVVFTFSVLGLGS